jgi:CheY-like chemotaxis protein
MNILIVEDDLGVLEQLREDITDRGLVAHCAVNGKEALHILETQVIDAVLSDFDMPVMDGLSLLGRIRKLWPHIPVAIMSGGPVIGDDYWKGIGAVAFLSKPFALYQLGGVVETFQREVMNRPRREGDTGY